MYKPEIPQNTGNIGRLAAATASRLHLIKPFGFDASNKQLKRAGLDYWPYLDLEIHNDFEHFMKGFQTEDIAVLTTKSKKPYYEIPKSCKVLLFGQETKGLPQSLHKQFSKVSYSIPMYHDQVRSLNLANSVSIVLYHQLHKRLQS